MTHWIADSLTLWRSPLTDAHLWTAAAYYSLLSKMNVYMAAATVAIVTVGFMGLVLSFQDGQAENLMFDGASICEWSCAIDSIQPSDIDHTPPSSFDNSFNPSFSPQSSMASQQPYTSTPPFRNSPNSQSCPCPSRSLLPTRPSRSPHPVSRPHCASRRSNSPPLTSSAPSPSPVSSSCKQPSTGRTERTTMEAWRPASIRAWATGNGPRGRA